MLEIILLIYLSRKIISNAHDKGRSGWYAAMLIGLWIGGEIAGMIVGSLISHASNPSRTGFDGLAYVFALAGAAAGAIISFVIVAALPVANAGPQQRGFAVDPRYPIR